MIYVYYKECEEPISYPSAEEFMTLCTPDVAWVMECGTYTYHVALRLIHKRSGWYVDRIADTGIQYWTFPWHNFFYRRYHLPSCTWPQFRGEIQCHHGIYRYYSRQGVPSDMPGFSNLYQAIAAYNGRYHMDILIPEDTRRYYEKTKGRESRTWDEFFKE